MDLCSLRVQSVPAMSDITLTEFSKSQRLIQREKDRSNCSLKQAGDLTTCWLHVSVGRAEWCYGHIRLAGWESRLCHSNCSKCSQFEHTLLKAMGALLELNQKGHGEAKQIIRFPSYSMHIWLKPALSFSLTRPQQGPALCVCVWEGRVCIWNGFLHFRISQWYFSKWIKIKR